MSTELTANERLIASREQLRHALRLIDARSEPGSGLSSETLASRLRADLKNSTPEAQILLELFQRWWTGQPLRIAWLLLADTATAVLQPVAQRHPYRLVIGAAAVGAVLVGVRPWRWFSTSALLAGVLPKLMSEVVLRLTPQPHEGHPPGSR